MNVDILTQFHFIRSEVLLLLPLALILFWLLQRATNNANWGAYIPPAMLQALQSGTHNSRTWWRWSLLGFWVFAIIASAGPTWNKQAVPVVKNQNALVIALDLSPSMLAEDITPNRLTRAKFKLIDLLRARDDGQTALIAYAGDAHTVSPLTDDPRTIEALLPALDPTVMPSSGSNTEAAISLAQQLIRDAGALSGSIVLITDGVTEQAIAQIKSDLSASNRLSILGVGNEDAVPIPDQGGGFIRNSKGEIVLTRLNASELRSLASATGGVFTPLRADDRDVEYLITDGFVNDGAADNDLLETQFDAWQDMGYLIALLLLPVLALLFRRGVIYLLPLIVLAPFDTQAESEDNSTWRNMWRTENQQGQLLYGQEQYAAAAETFERADWSAVAEYKAGDYDATIKLLEGHDDPISHYNRANALAMKGELQQAIEAYESALKADPEHADAQYNKALLEELLKNQQSENQQSNGQQSDSRQSDSQQSDSQQSDNQQSDSQQSESQQSDSQQSDSQQSDSQQSESQQSDSQQSDSERSDSQQTEGNQPDDPSNADNESAAERDHSAAAERNEETDQQGEKNADSTEYLNANEPSDDDSEQTTDVSNDSAPTELKDSSEQWLRSIQDDPSGLLRRKFEYQARQRKQQRTPPNSSAEERY